MIADQVLAELAKRGSDGTTAKEIADTLGVRPPLASAALRELADAKLIRVTDWKRAGWLVWLHHAVPKPAPTPALKDRFRRLKHGVRYGS